jgi:hypothetical protein
MKAGGLQSVPYDNRNIEMRYFLTPNEQHDLDLKPLYAKEL